MPSDVRGQGQREGSPSPLNKFHQLFEAFEGISMEFMRLIDKQGHWTILFSNEFQQFALPFFGLARDTYFFARRQIIIKRMDRNFSISSGCKSCE
jgi:hypothetical protein